MCAINGVTEQNRALVERMNAKTAHRGPDATDVYVDKDITLGHNRLSIIDLSSSANQPMRSPDGRYVLVFNGEIYNYREIRKELETEWSFRTASDTEVLLAGYSVWGKAVLDRISGIFAVAVWDKSQSELFLARDHMGVKPLYYAILDRKLYFSSELQGIIEATGKRTLNEESLAHYMSIHYAPSSHTLIEGIEKLSPAHCLTFKNGSAEIIRYWTPEAPTESSLADGDVQTIIGNGIHRQLVSDRPVGILLSGGIDSSIVLHHASSKTHEVKTFSVDFEMVSGAEEDAERFNADARLAERTAGLYGATHTTFTLSLEDIRNELMSALGSFDEPIANPTAVTRYLISKWVREMGIVVALGGDGGDELFGGYPRYQITQSAFLYQKLPHVLRRAMSELHPQLRKLNLPLGTAMHLQLMALKSDKYGSIFKRDIVGTHTARFFTERYADRTIEALHPVDRFMRVDRETWLADESLAQTDRMSMAHGLELRVPLLDLDTVRLADKMFGMKKMTPFTNKMVLRDAYAHVLPEYLFKQPKRGWISPGAKWFRDEEVKRMMQQILTSSYYSGLDSFIDWNSVQSLLDDHIEKRGYYLYPLWDILVLQVWAQKHSIVIDS